VTSILLVAGTNHRKYAHALREALTAQGHEITVVTAKTTGDTLRHHVTVASAVVWLASPQTTGTKPYIRLLNIIRKRQLPLIPVAVQPYQSEHLPPADIQLSRDISRTAEQITAKISPSRGNSRLLAGAGGLIVLLLILFAVISLLSSTTLEETLPTLVVLQSEADNAQVTIDVTAANTLTPRQSTSLDTAGLTEATAEVTAETTADPESTVDPDFLTLMPVQTSITATATQPPLLVDFSVDVSRGDAPLNVNVTNLSTGLIQGYQWDYESDGVVDSTNIQAPTITYSTPGIYVLTLRVIDTDNTVLQSQKTIEVFDSTNTAQSNSSSGGANASFLTSPSSGQAPLQVRFTNRTLGNNLTFRWDFNGDGNIDFQGASPPVYTYSRVGTYTARLEAIAENGSVDRAQAQVNVYSSSPDDEVEQIYDTDSKADFSVSPASGQVPIRVAITNLSVGTNNSYEWDFNSDGMVDSASEQPQSQRYATPGTYTITLTVKGFDRFGTAKSSQARIQVIASPRNASPTATPNIATSGDPLDVYAEFFADNNTGTAPLTVQYFNYSSGENITYQWDFDGDGNIDSTAFEPTHIFNNGGDFETFLYVTDGTTTDVSSLTIEVTGGQTQASATPASGVTIQPSATRTLTRTPTRTPTTTVIEATAVNPTATRLTPTATFTHTFTPSPTYTVTPSPTFTRTLTPTPTITPSLTPTATLTHTPTPTLTFTVTPSNTPTATPTDIPETDD